jgi:hypothetical protein
MRRWFLSYTSQDFALTQALKAALQRKDPDANIFFAPESMRAGGFWKKQLAEQIEGATAFILLVGEKGLGDWQVMEYYEALDRRAHQPDYPIIFVLSAKRPAPGLPFARQLHWVLTEDPASEATIGKLLDAASGPAERPGELWRFTRPYRGLEAMTEANSDYFFGRGRETVDVINALASERGKLPILLGNSGVGKSSLAQAGVLAALVRQGWPEQAENAGPWPIVFDRSRHWSFLTLRPGAEPVRALAEPFIRAWQFDPTDQLREQRLNEWTYGLKVGTASLRGLLDATQDRLHELGQVPPPSFFLYVDQGEELYVRSEKRQRRRFSEIIAAGLSDERLRGLMSVRADFFGELQKDAPLFAIHRQINVPPLREAELQDVVSAPARLLSARFQTDTLAADIARRTAEDSTEDAGALPLLSYLLDDMWSEMVQRGDGVLRLPTQAIDLGRVLVERADKFLAEHPHSEDSVRRILTLKLATVRENSEPTRRRARRSEFSEDEWKLVSELVDHPNRLLVTGTPERGEPYSEVAHEAIFRRWHKLRDWVAQEREFLVWKNDLDSARRRWQGALSASRDDALLMGLALDEAQNWMARRGGDMTDIEKQFINESLKKESRERLQKETLHRRVRGTTIYASIVVPVIALFAALLLVYFTWTTRRLITAQITSTVDAEIIGLSEQYRQGGLRRLGFTVDARARRPGPTGYLLTTAAGESLAGNVESLAAGVLNHPGWHEAAYRRPDDTGADRRSLVRVFQLPEGFNLVVGSDLDQRDAFLNHILRSSGLGALILVILALLGGFVAMRWILKEPADGTEMAPPRPVQFFRKSR